MRSCIVVGAAFGTSRGVGGGCPLRELSPARSPTARGTARPCSRAGCGRSLRGYPSPPRSRSLTTRVSHVSRARKKTDATMLSRGQVRASRLCEMATPLTRARSRYAAIARLRGAGQGRSQRDLQGRRVGVSSQGAAAASAAAKRRGDASRKAKRQARAPEEDTPARRTGDTIKNCAPHQRRHEGQRSPP